MNSSTGTEAAKRINGVLRREGFKVTSKKDARGRYWEVEGSETVVIEYWLSPTDIVIAPSRADKSHPYLMEWSTIRHLIRAIQRENLHLNDFLRGAAVQSRKSKVSA
jgi:hypothetical protein